MQCQIVRGRERHAANKGKKTTGEKKADVKNLFLLLLNFYFLFSEEMWRRRQPRSSSECPLTAEAPSDTHSPEHFSRPVPGAGQY